MKLKVMFLAMLIILSALFASCSKPETQEEWEPPKKEEAVGTEAESEEESEPAMKEGIKTINFVFASYSSTGQPQGKDLIETMREELNARIVKKIDAIVEFDWLPYNTYQESVMMKIASEEGLDVIDTIYGGSTVFRELLDNDMLLDIKDDFRIYMPDTYKLLYEKCSNPDDYLLTNGAQYIIPKIDAYPIRGYIITQKNIYDEYGKKIETLEDYEDYMQWISENKSGMDAGYAEPMDVIDIYLNGHGYVGKNTSIYTTLESNDNMALIERIPEFRDVYEMLKRWNERGYCGSVKIYRQFMAAQKGSLASMLINPNYSHSNSDTITLPTSIEFEYIVLYKDTEMVSIADLKGPSILKYADAAVEALMFYELIYNEQDFYDIVQYGIENVNYRKIGEKLILPEQTSKAILEWWGSDNFYNYTMARPVWSEPEDYVQFFEDTAFYNMVDSKEIEKRNNSGGYELDEKTIEKLNNLYEEGLNPLLLVRNAVYLDFIDKIGEGDYSMTADEAIEMLDAGNAQKIVDTYEMIWELYYPTP